MLRASILFSVIALCAGTLAAQDDLASYQTAMKAGATATGAARAAIAAKDNAAVAAQAKIIAESFDQIGKYWAKKQKDDAVKLSETARDAGKELGAATSSDDQTAALLKVSGTCRGCHATYRAGNNFK